MKKIILLAFVLLPVFSFASSKSPSQTATLTLNGHELKIIYSAPSVRNRAGHIFDAQGLISHDPNYPVWRAGANGATIFHTDTDLEVGQMKVPKGDYTFFVDIKDPEKWVLIINGETGQWGLKYHADKDLGRIPMTMSKPRTTVETLKYDIQGSGKSGTIQLGWENYLAQVPFTLK